MAENETEKETEVIIEDKPAEKAEDESMMDYASRRLVELRNSEQKFLFSVSQAETGLEQARANLIACKARIDEMTMIIEKESPPPKKP